MLHKANDAVNRDLLDEALDELINRVDDWKNHKVEQFGRLLLHGVYGVITGKSEQEKDVRALKTCETHLLTLMTVRDFLVREHPPMLQGAFAQQEQGQKGQDTVSRS